jgi:hypothetical protein
MFAENNTMSTETRLIEIKRVLSDDDKNNYTSEKETFDVNMIQSYRSWHKGKKDEKIKGDMTLIVLKPTNFDSANTRPRTMLIEEDYDSFSNRVSYKVPVHRLA